MPVEANDFFTVANQLASFNSEIELRCAISRSYYGAHHSLLVLEAELPVNDHRKVKHGGVHLTLNSKFTEVCDQSHIPDDKCRLLKRLGILSENMRLARVKADYKLDETIVLDDVQKQLQLAERFQALTKELGLPVTDAGVG